MEAGDHKGRPYYRQRDTEGKADHFLYSEGGKWWVHDSLGKSVGRLSNPQNSPEPPTSGWVYSAGEGLTEYRDDNDSLTLELNILHSRSPTQSRGKAPWCRRWAAAWANTGLHIVIMQCRAKKFKNMQQVGVGNVERGSTSVQESWRSDEVSARQGGKD